MTLAMEKEKNLYRGPARELEIRGKEIFMRSQIVQEFEAIHLEVSGVIKREEARPMAVINNYILVEDEIVPFEHKLKIVKIDVKKQLVYFTYRGEKVSKKLQESAKK